jgi:hypothetical protein
MTNAKSAPVLDSADDFESKLSWILFKQEQDRRLFVDPPRPDANGNPTWSPGDNLYPFPRAYIDFSGRSNQRVVYIGNYPRPMFELSDVNVFHAPGMDLNDSIVIRCEDCEVNWRGDDPCFVCGRQVPDRVRFDASLLKDGHVTFGGLSVDTWTELSLEPMVEGFRSFAEAMRETGRQITMLFDTMLTPNEFRSLMDPLPVQDRTPANIEGLIAFAVSDITRTYINYPRQNGRSRFFTILDEAGGRTEYQANGITIPYEFLTEPVVPLPRPVFESFSTDDGGVRNWPGSEQITTRRRE